MSSICAFHESTWSHRGSIIAICIFSPFSINHYCNPSLSFRFLISSSPTSTSLARDAAPFADSLLTTPIKPEVAYNCLFLFSHSRQVICKRHTRTRTQAHSFQYGFCSVMNYKPAMLWIYCSRLLVNCLIWYRPQKRTFDAHIEPLWYTKNDSWKSIFNNSYKIYFIPEELFNGEKLRKTIRIIWCTQRPLFLSNFRRQQEEQTQYCCFVLSRAMQIVCVWGFFSWLY